MGILNNPAILRIRVPFQDFQPMEILNLELLISTCLVCVLPKVRAYFAAL